mmetsp:Transcript_16753/g.39150  ORF Transcript_16753/g.39150 Transcript_16753/m.39150 type:complete len:632 (+) Transcript_16753:69-1964(+)
MQTLPQNGAWSTPPLYQVGPPYGLLYEGQVTGYQPLPEERIIRLPPEYWRYAENPMYADQPGQPMPDGVEEFRLQQQEELLHQQQMLQQHIEQQQIEQEMLRQELERAHAEKMNLLEQRRQDEQRLIPAVVPQVMRRMPAEEAFNQDRPAGDNDGRGGIDDDDGNNDQFLSLLESLEARIDLMAQMQHTRVAIQKRAQALEVMRAQENRDAIAMYDPGFAAQQQDPALVGPEGTDLWTYLQEQRECISQLTREVEGMRHQMRAVSSGFPPALEDRPGGQFPALTVAPHLQAQLEDTLRAEKVLDAERELERQLADERRQQVMAAQLRMQERSKLYAEISEAQRQTNPRGGGDGLATLLALPTSLEAAGPRTINLGRSLETQSRDVGYGEQGSPQRAREVWSPPAPKLFGEPPLVPPLSSDMCGVNVELSEDGYTATRARGCRQSVALGSGPLVRQASGWYFEVGIQETVSGWVGGLGIGVTRTPPGGMTRVPDKAWRLPSTFIVGYWGCVFLDGMERKAQWRPDDLQAGQRVGFLVTGDGRGDIIVFVDDKPVVHVPGAMLAREMNMSSSVAVGVPEPMFPIVDIFAATRTVAMLKRATPPPRPWDTSSPAVRPSSPTATVDGMSVGRGSM